MQETTSRRMPRTRPPAAGRAGSALLIVLGLLAILMLLGISFSVFVQTEHAGATNLKNGFVARQSLNSAVGRVMEAIDLSFGSPSNDWPVCVWPQAWLASSESEALDYYQSEILKEDEVADAHILTAEAARFLTPSQLALAKSAKCGWAPIYAAVQSEGPRTDKGGGLVGNKGRDNADSVIGRYAFIALETTGLLDANAAGSAGAGRSANAGEDPTTYYLPGSGNEMAKFEHSTDLGNNNFVTEEVSIPHTLADRAKFLSARDRTRGRDNRPQLASFADLAAVAGSALDSSKPGKGSSDNAAELSKKPFPADLFNTFYASLADLDPEGQPKIVLPAGSIGQSDAGLFAARAFPAMVKVFANARADTSLAGGKALNPASNDGDQYTFFEGTDKAFSLTRARLATVAMLDAMDADSVPGQWASANNYSAWQRLPDVNGLKVNVVDAEGNARTVSVSDSLPRAIKEGSPLNLPCTENVPMLSRVYARLLCPNGPSQGDVGQDDPKDMSTCWLQFDAALVLGAVATSQGDETPSEESKLTVDCEILSGSPVAGSTTQPGASGDIGSQIWNPAAPKPHQKWTCPQLDNFVPATASKTVSFEGSGKSVIVAESGVPFKIRCYAACYANGTPFPDPSDPKKTQPLPSQAVLNRCFDFQGLKFYPATVAEENTGATELFLPVRFKATVKTGGRTVQQVPAPCLDTGGNEGAYRVRVDAGLYHQPGSRFVKNPPAKAGTVPWGRQFALGWAMCLDPVFAFDTTSLKASGANTIGGNSGCNFWISNAASYSGSGAMWDALNGYMVDPDTAYNALHSTAQWNYLQLNWLFNYEKFGTDPFDKWMYRGAKYSMRPDMMHSDSDSGAPFCQKGGTLNDTRLKKQLPFKLANAPFDSVGQLGNVRIGPYETLSTVRSYRFGSGGVTDFHRVLDYFTATEDRYPTYGGANGPTVDATTGEVDYSRCTELFSGLSRGRVNLNMPRLVRWNNKKATRAVTDDKNMPLNPYPAIAALTGASLGSGGGTISFNLASKIVARIADTAGEEVENTVGFKSAGKSPKRYVVRRVSDLGWAEINGRNPILTDIIQTAPAAADSDESREAYIGNAVNAFTTRGQTFVVILRADAYTPRYGEEASTGDGTTLATTHAVLELFRDPEYARYPDGAPLQDADGNPVFFHNWYIKSFHVL